MEKSPPPPQEERGKKKSEVYRRIWHSGHSMMTIIEFQSGNAFFHWLFYSCMHFSCPFSREDDDVPENLDTTLFSSDFWILCAIESINQSINQSINRYRALAVSTKRTTRRSSAVFRVTYDWWHDTAWLKEETIVAGETFHCSVQSGKSACSCTHWFRMNFAPNLAAMSCSHFRRSSTLIAVHFLGGIQQSCLIFTHKTLLHWKIFFAFLYQCDCAKIQRVKPCASNRVNC